jgi:hypothetical protein
MDIASIIPIVRHSAASSEFETGRERKVFIADDVC